MLNNKRSKGMVYMGNIKRLLQVPIKNHKVSVPSAAGPKTKKLLDFLSTISGTRVSHTRVHLEARLALPSICYADFKQLSLTVGLNKVEMHQVNVTGRKSIPFRGGQPALSFPGLMPPTGLKVSLFLPNKHPQTALLWASVIITAFLLEHKMILPFSFILWVDSYLCAFVQEKVGKSAYRCACV